MCSEGSLAAVIQKSTRASRGTALKRTHGICWQFVSRIRYGPVWLCPWTRTTSSSLVVRTRTGTMRSTCSTYSRRGGWHFLPWTRHELVTKLSSESKCLVTLVRRCCMWLVEIMTWLQRYLTSRQRSGASSARTLSCCRTRFIVSRVD